MKNLLLIVGLLVGSVSCFLLAAETNVTNAPLVLPQRPPIDPATMVSFWNGLIVLLVPVAVQLIKKMIPSVPKLIWPLVAVLLGVASDWLLAQVGALANNSWQLGALCGASGVAVREISRQLMLAVMATVDLPAEPSSSPPPPAPDSPLPPATEIVPAPPCDSTSIRDSS